MKDTRQFPFRVVVSTVSGFGGNSEQTILEDRLAVGFTGIGTGKQLKEIGDFTHLYVDMRSQFLVLFLFIVLVPPFVTAPLGPGCSVLLGVVEVEDFTPTVLVGSL